MNPQDMDEVPPGAYGAPRQGIAVTSARCPTGDYALPSLLRTRSSSSAAVSLRLDVGSLLRIHAVFQTGGGRSEDGARPRPLLATAGRRQPFRRTAGEVLEPARSRVHCPQSILCVDWSAAGPTKISAQVRKPRQHTSVRGATMALLHLS